MGKIVLDKTLQFYKVPIRLTTLRYFQTLRAAALKAHRIN